MENQGSIGDTIDVSYLENACDVVYTGNTQNPSFQQFHDTLMEFQDRDDAWIYADKLIDNCKSQYARFFGVQILHSLVKYKWKMLEPDQRQPVKDFICQHTINWAQDPNVTHYILSEIDKVLVEIIVLEWPQEWPSIVDDLIASATSEPGTCQNNLKIISMLSQQVFDFGTQEMTSTRISQVSAALNEAAPQVFNLVENVLSGTEDPKVISTALEAFRYIVKWLDPHYIFETQVLDALCNSFLTNPQYQSYVLSIIGEISAKDLPEQYAKSFPAAFELIISALQQTMQESNLEDLENESPDTVKSIIFTLSSFLSTYGGAIEASDQLEPLHIALEWVIELMKITEFDNFKSCCELWRTIIKRFYLEKNANLFDFYQDFFPILRRIFVARIEKPVEVLIIENDDGSYEKEVTKNSAHVDHYNTMRECLVLLSNINGEDTVLAISEKMEELHETWSISTLNCICWSAGAISGTLSPQDEKQFVIMVLKDLLQLSANERAGIEDKAMIAAGIMFVCSSYPRFLTASWAFLRVIEEKLFEFMQNDFAGVKEMAVDSFTRIAEKCKKQFLLSQAKGEPPFIEYLIAKFDGITSNLSNELKADMIKAMAIIISGCSDNGLKATLTNSLMEEMNNKWSFQLGQFQSDNIECLYNILFILKCNMYVASKIGISYNIQFNTILEQMLQMYETCCSTCSEILEQGGDVMSQSEIFKINYQIKATIVQIMIQFTESATNIATIRNVVLPPLTMNLLEEFANSNPYCRIPDLLTLMKAIILKVEEQSIAPFMEQIMTQLFKPSVELICDDYDSFMQFRIPLTEFMNSIVNKAFTAFINLPPDVITMMENAIEWGCQHPNVDICKESIELLQNLYIKVEGRGAPQAFKNQFYETFYISTVDTMFLVLTDTVHKYAFVEQCKFIRKLFSMQIEQNNPEAIVEILSSKFPGREPQFFQLVIEKLYQLLNQYSDFKEILRDFLVEVKQISREDPDFYVEERNKEREQNQQIDNEIPGMTGPADVDPNLIFDDFLD